MAGEIVSSAADMISGLDLSGTAFDGGGSDVDTSAPDLSLDAEGEQPLSDGIEEGIQPAESEGEVPDDAVPEAEDELPVPETPEEPAPAAELPEGVREATINGKKEMRLTPQRYELFHGAHKTLREFEQMAGEPITPDTFDVRNRAYIGQEKLYGDLLSGEPESQAKVLGHFFDEASQAFQNGEVSADPSISLAQTFYDTLQAKSPDAFAHLRMKAADSLVNEMYQEAQRTGDRNIAVSASHIAKALGIGYKNDNDIAQLLATRSVSTDPITSLRAEKARLEQQLNQQATTKATEQYDSWKSTTVKAVTSGVLSEAVSPSLETERKAWEKFPTQFENLVVAPLNKAVKQTIGQDSKFGERIQLLEQAAKRATAQKRGEIAGQIKQLYINRAKLAVDAHKATVLREAATLLKQGNDATHQRRAAAQQQRGPRGPQVPAPASIAPKQVVNPGGIFDAKAETARLRQLMGA
jgi:hypothetical protein